MWKIGQTRINAYSDSLTLIIFEDLQTILS